MVEVLRSAPRSARPSAGSSPRFAANLAAVGARPAIHLDSATLSYSDLDSLVDERADALGPTRRLIALSGSNDLDTVVSYLAAQKAGHAVALAPNDQTLGAIVDTFDPDVVIDSGGDLRERRAGTAHEMHPELSLLLSTSGTTGSPKLVRLSRTSIESNAAAIAQYLELTPDDRAITTLPLGYCYGLSVLHSHLHVGASVVLNDFSVLDSCFWDRFQRHGATSFAGVPYTFDLLEQVGFAELDLPTLRTVTQAGGRLTPEQVRRYAQLGRSKGWRLFVMYGQTEATARMAYLEPELADTHPTCIGRPIPGGSFELEPVEEAGAGVGELVYRGPNVMDGYAERPADLASGATLTSLRTGDLARRTPEGLFEIVGRSSRFLKLFGLRVDLDRAERILADAGLDAVCSGDDHGLVAGVRTTGGTAVEQDARRLLVEKLGLPIGSITVVAFDELPRLPSGKPDLRSVRDAATTRRAAAATSSHSPRATVAGLYAQLLGVEQVEPEDTFVALGGDSLSYVELAHRLEALRGPLPDGWHHMSVAELDRPAAHQPTSRPWTRVDTTVVIRAVSILAIVASHLGAIRVEGGGHLLLAIAGVNAARFWFDRPDRVPRVRTDLTRIARIAVPTMLYCVAGQILIGHVYPTTIALFSTYARDGIWRYRYWFVEALVQIMLVLLVLLSVKTIRRWERRNPFWFAGAVLAATLLLREVTIGPYAFSEVRTHNVAWLFALGWLAQRADTTTRRVLVSIVAVAAMHGWFVNPQRELFIVAGLLVTIWWERTPVPRLAHRPLVLIAGASFAIYLISWTAVDLFLGVIPGWTATIVTILAGIAIWTTGVRLRRAAGPIWRGRVAAIRNDRWTTTAWPVRSGGPARLVDDRSPSALSSRSA